MILVEVITEEYQCKCTHKQILIQYEKYFFDATRNVTTAVNINIELLNKQDCTKHSKAWSILYNKELPWHKN
jgi:hypothetical protein